MTIARRVRGILGEAAIWGIGWLVILVPWVLDTFREESCVFSYTFADLLRATIAIVGWGAGNGALFALCLSVAGRRRALSELSAVRVIGCGFASGAWLPLALGVVWWSHLFHGLVPIPVLTPMMSGTLGGSLAAIVLTLARSGATDTMPEHSILPRHGGVHVP